MRTRVKAFTLIELLVVVAIIALLLAVLLPNLASAREQGRRAKCLANLRNITAASHQYAQEDKKDLLIPAHAGVYQNQWSYGQYLWWRVGTPSSWGGATPTHRIANILNLPILVDPNGPWSAKTRPLNRYLLKNVYGDDSDRRAFDMYACPSETGFPNNDKWVTNDFVAGNQAVTSELYEKCFFDIVGNSYRNNTIGSIWISGQVVQRHFSSGPFGSKASKITAQVGRIVLYSEPLFYIMTVPQTNLNPDLSPLRGTHKQIMTENVAYVDGSGRSTRVGVLAQWDSATLEQMGYFNPADSGGATRYLRRGSTWQTDVYPTPGSVIRGYTGTVPYPVQGLPTGGWPGAGYQDNLLHEF